MVARVYAANTVGAIIGALATSILLIRWLGTQHAQQVLIGLSAIGALIVLVPMAASKTPAGFPGKATAWVSLIGAAALAALLAWNVPRIPWQLVAHGRYLATYGPDRMLLYLGEGMNSSVAVTEMNDTGIRNFHVSGKVEASTDPRDMRACNGCSATSPACSTRNPARYSSSAAARA